MIITVTLNPSLDRTMLVHSLVRGEVLRADATRDDPGGKDVNMARAFAADGEQPCAVLPACAPGGVLGAAGLSSADGLHADYSARVTSPTVGDVVAALDALYPPQTAEEWDVVGLTCGERSAPVRRVMFAVDPLPSVVDETIAWGADLLVTHHPLLLRPTHSVATDTWKGSVLHRLVRNGCALYTAHTNADVAQGGVNESLADALGLLHTTPLRPWPAEAADKVVTFVPPEQADDVMAALTEVGAGTIGDYSGCAWKVSGTGIFTPGRDANPTIGEVGRTEVTTEVRVEMLVPRRLRGRALAALRAAHPYEEVAIDVVELASASSGTGLGRIGTLTTPVPLRGFAEHVAAALPPTPAGVRFHGDPEEMVSRVAVCGGSGESLLQDAERAGVDAFVTADLRHHPTSEHLASGGPALVDPGHWASEWPWLPIAAEALSRALADGMPVATTVETHISTVVTDPVTGHVRSCPEEDH